MPALITDKSWRPPPRAERRQDPAFQRQYDRMLRAYLPTYAAEILRGPEGSQFGLGPHHLRWGDMINRASRILALAARDHGKCVAAGSQVLMADHTSRAIELVAPGDLVMSYGAGGMAPRRVEAVMATGSKPTIGLAFSTGRRLAVTPEHKVRTPTGWRCAGDLQVGDEVVATLALGSPGVKTLDDDEVALLAYVIAEGCLPVGVWISTASPEIVEDIERIAVARAWIAVHEPAKTLVRLVGHRGKGQWGRTNTGPIAWTRRHPEIAGRLAYHKRVPAGVMNAPADQVALFLNRLWSCDGYMREIGAEITLANELLIDDVRTLLHRVGVVATKTRADKAGSTHPTWRLSVQDAPNLLKLATVLGPLIGKPHQTEQAINAARARKPQRSRVYRATPDGTAAVVKLLAVEDLGVRETYDLQIEGVQNFVVDHVVVHNSYFWSLAYPLWMVDRRAPGRLGYIFSSTRPLARELLDKVRRELLGGGNENGPPNPKLAHLLPLRKDSADEIIVANGGAIRARGITTKVRGGHPWWAVADDIGSDDWMWSSILRAKGTETFLSGVEPMVVPGGQLVVVGTPFHAQDLYATLAQNGVFQVTRDPALDHHGVPLWPARYDLARLETKRRILASSLRWSREFLVQPISDEASLFPRYLFDSPGVLLPYKLGLSGDYWRSRGFQLYAGVDLAMSASASADWLVVFVIAVDPTTGDRYVVDIVRRKGLGYQEQVDLISNVARRYGVALCLVEANQFQRVISDMIIRTTDLPIRPFYTTGKVKKQIGSDRRGMRQSYSANKNALDQGVPSLRMLLENGKLRIPYDPETRDTVEAWIGEMTAFGWGEGKLQGVGAHDDTVMAFWIADRAAQVGSTFRFSMGPDDGDTPVASNGAPAGPVPDFFGSDDSANNGGTWGWGG